MGDEITKPELRQSAAELHDALEAYAARAERKATRITTTAKTLTKPAEQATRRDLERRARAFSEVTWNARSAMRAIKAMPLENDDA